MARTSADVPDESSILCESCGYTLDGLPPDSNCPECGTPAVESMSGDGRRPPLWETGVGSDVLRWTLTTFAILFKPSHFFRHSTTRGSLGPARIFAMTHWFISAVLFSDAARAHWLTQDMGAMSFVPGAAWIGLIALTFGALALTTRIASSLTAWEARYRGIRLPKTVVLRGLYYHAAHYIPVALVALLTTTGYRLLERTHYFKANALHAYMTYLIVLSAEVILAAAYLFWTYWAAMRNMMYANR
jgi:hypothetical protein